MVRAPVFEVEKWIDEKQYMPGVIDLAATCASPITLKDLTALSNDSAQAILFPDALDYGQPLGSQNLRRVVAEMCGENPLEKSEALSADDVIVTQGAIGANFAVLYTLINPGDHIVCVYPTYQQLYSIPAALGAEVSLWKLREENGYVPDIKELERLLKPHTKMIIINNPNNPMGVPIPRSVVEAIVEVARKHDLTLLSDEVYRPLFQCLFTDVSKIAPCAATLGYDKAIITGSMSKAFAMAGVRIGWIACKSKAIIKAIEASRQYTTISVSQLDDHIASFALSQPIRTAILQRNVDTARANLDLVEGFVNKFESICSWHKPSGGTTAFIKFSFGGAPVDDEKLCLDLIEKAGVFLVPGKRCFGGGEDFAGYVRMGYVGQTNNVEEGLRRLGAYLTEHFQNQEQQG